MDSEAINRYGAAVPVLVIVSTIAIVGGVPAALLIAGTIGVWTAVAIYVVSITLVTVVSESLQWAIRSR